MLQSSSKAKGKGGRKVSVKVIMLDKYQHDVPRSDDRKRLEYQKKVKKIFVTRNDTPSELRTKISWIFGTSSYQYLECVCSGNKLILSSNQNMNGQDAIHRRGYLYMCKKVLYSYW